MIRLENVTYHYNKRVPALDSVSIDIDQGEFVGVIGKNGSGKTTILRHMNGLLLPGEGSVTVKGMDTKDPSSIFKIRQVAGMVFQDPGSQFIGMTVEEDIAFGPENLGLPPGEIRRRVENSLSAVGMTGYNDHTPRTLSGGQKQKVALASVLAMEPEVILFDEVTSMLDPDSRKEVLSLITQLHENGTTIIYVTHCLEELVHADRLIIMEKGRIKHDDNPRLLIGQGNVVNSGLGLPTVMELSRRLLEAGFFEPASFPLSREELRDLLCQLK
ncbi:energy-coupling factor transporter ATPase [Methanolobus sp. WCC5]|uniref:energy-coupling factor transporter ATPase n=1 Tax=Methanolobus sp. WCC5 TaxID=3125785 RepID=UPI003255728F